MNRTMTMTIRLAAVAVAIFSAVLTAEAAEPADERTAVEQAVYDYVDALYLMEPARIEASVHPELAKRGFMPSRNAPGYSEYKMTFAQLRDLAGTWNRSGRVDPKGAVRNLVVLDMLDQVASAKLVAHWGVDYLHLAKYDGRWRIVNVIWQSAPKKAAPAAPAP